ncbi:TPA: hypothetical protein H1011_02455 [archaeon]|jgi:hypothetical protein|uniref:Uncharacterized protein n=1 Tax=Candidatus Undinarchaeum marinum TaxID=2756141 RepID=A0A832XIS6_9ARCH|nr:hypothetical protein [Candidatus Undinarchaeum marinum]
MRNDLASKVEGGLGMKDAVTKGRQYSSGTPNPGKFITTIVMVFLVGLIITLAWAANVGGENEAINAILLLSVIFLLSRMSILNQIGIAFVHIILFGLMLYFSLWLVLSIIVVTTLIMVRINTKPRLIDFAIIKDSQIAITQLIYLSIWTLIISVVFELAGTNGILINLGFYYFLSLTVYMVFFVILTLILTARPVPEVVIRIVLIYMFNWILYHYVLIDFLNYLRSVAPV